MAKWLPVLLVMMLAACAGKAPVPGGTETTNATYYSSQDDFKSRVGRLQAGMPEDLVFQILQKTRDDLVRLSRNEIVVVLYGANSMQMMNTFEEREANRLFLQSLYGYRMTYKDVKKKHGFASLIRIRTDESGFNYTVNLVFQNGILLETPVIEGGLVHESESRTFFDYLSPGTVMDQVK
ncbi:MAG TPA: hypothetical protein VIN59_06080 [Alphaproteobacteria bacterium]